MDKETFNKNLSTLLDVLNNNPCNHTILRGDNASGKGMFRIGASGFSYFEIAISDGGPVLAWVKDVGKDNILDMLSDYVVSTTEKMYIFVSV